MKHGHHHEANHEGSHEKSKEHPEAGHHEHHNMKKDNLWRHIWIYTSILLTIVIIVMVFAKDDLCAKAGKAAADGDNALADEFVFLYSDACAEPCDELEPVAKEISEKSGMVFRKIKYPQPIEEPGYFVLKGDDSTVPTLIADKATLYSDMCTITENEEVCKEAETLKEQAETEKYKEFPKSDKPVVEVFVMSHCPYGTQIEKGILPVAELLGDKIDLEIKFVNYAMHGEKELNEQMLQYCIQSEQTDKYLEYLACFLEEGESLGCVVETGVDKAKADSCIAATDAKYKITEMFNDKSTWQGGSFPQFPIHEAECEKYQVQGSPTTVINGKEQQVGRDPASLLKAVCASFNTAPAECATQLSSANPSPGFGYSTTTNTDQQQC